MAAGLGTRLRPFTLHHPKALAPVEGVPMLERVIVKLRDFGFNDITINVHHFADQIVRFLEENDFGVNCNISDESDLLLDTGGGILNAARYIAADDAPFLVHNVDILSNADLKSLMYEHIASGRDVTLLTSGRDSSRKLLFDAEGVLQGWHNLTTGEFRPAEFAPSDVLVEEAFSGIYMMNRNAVLEMRRYSGVIGKRSFPIMNFFLDYPHSISIGRVCDKNLRLLDIGKPATLAAAPDLLQTI